MAGCGILFPSLGFSHWVSPSNVSTRYSSPKPCKVLYLSAQVYRKNQIPHSPQQIRIKRRKTPNFLSTGNTAQHRKLEHYVAMGDLIFVTPCYQISYTNHITTKILKERPNYTIWVHKILGFSLKLIPFVCNDLGFTKILKEGPNYTKILNPKP